MTYLDQPWFNRKTIDAYTLKAGKIVTGYFSKLPDPADHPVYILTPQLSLRST